jgi:hypothetical protein
MRTPGPKKSTPRRAELAEGGTTPMHGRGDRTKTATTDAAGTQRPSITGQEAKDNPKLAKGGSRQGMFKAQAGGEINDAEWARWEHELIAAGREGRIIGALDLAGR